MNMPVSGAFAESHRAAGETPHLDSFGRSDTGPRDIPREPRTLAEAELPERLVADLLLRHLERASELRAAELINRLGLPFQVLEPVLGALRAASLIEVRRRGTFEADASYALTDAGRSQAVAANERCRYLGPAPVRLEAYAQRVSAQRRRDRHTDLAGIRAALSDAIVADEVVATIGSAINSGRALFLWGAGGTGKTFLAERIAAIVTDPISVPHAILVDGEVIRVFDPLVHRRIETPASQAGRDASKEGDRRWVTCHRPIVPTGGELTLEMLELRMDPVERFYIAPPQLKANNGTLLVDDLGRQRVLARDLINRWIVPLDRGVDYLTLGNGARFVAPFDVSVIFSSNLSPAALADDSLSRRMGYRLEIGAMDEASYREVFRRACDRFSVVCDEAAIELAIHGLHVENDIPLHAVTPGELVSRVHDHARFQGVAPILDEASLRRAWALCFGQDGRRLASGSETR